MWSEMYFVGQGLLNKEFAEKYKGWKNYRVEYYKEGEKYKDMECSIWLPEKLSIYTLEGDICDCIYRMNK